MTLHKIFYTLSLFYLWFMNSQNFIGNYSIFFNKFNRQSGNHEFVFWRIYVHHNFQKYKTNKSIFILYFFLDKLYWQRN